MIAALQLTVKEVNSSDQMKSMSFWKSSVACAVFREMRESSKGILHETTYTANEADDEPM